MMTVIIASDLKICNFVYYSITIQEVHAMIKYVLHFLFPF